MPIASTIQPLLHSRDVARILGVSTAWLERARCYGGGPDFIKKNGAVRYEPAAIEAWIDAHRHGGGPV